MTNEIKEILDRLFVYRNENDEMKYQPEDILTIEDVWLLLDYITNLQEENERLHNIIKEVRYFVVTHKLYNFKYDDEELFEIVTDKKIKDELLQILDKGE